MKKPFPMAGIVAVQTKAAATIAATMAKPAERTYLVTYHQTWSIFSPFGSMLCRSNVISYSLQPTQRCECLNPSEYCDKQ